jgi:hypothetical protein
MAVIPDSQTVRFPASVMTCETAGWDCQGAEKYPSSFYKLGSPDLTAGIRVHSSIAGGLPGLCFLQQR